mmetsp:Transcript_8338/g.18162  ORF Transcript_8338/g.18162 Transcript_8338/m.18162 type:complete len:200 (+) Transcript_8338:3-602(+)
MAWRRWGDACRLAVWPLVYATASQQQLVVLVGIPGSGKSTFSQQILHSAPSWVRVNQDTLGTRKRCMALAKAELLKGSNILIDRCNFDVQQRSHWLTLPRADVLRRTAVFLDVPTEVALERVLSRKSHEGQVDSASKSERKLREIVSSMARSLRAPKREEGFDAVFHCRNIGDVVRATAFLVEGQLSPLQENQSLHTDW